MDSATLSPMLKRCSDRRDHSVAPRQPTNAHAVELTTNGRPCAAGADDPPEVVERLGVGLDELEQLQ